MRFKFVTTVAAALIAGIAGFTFTTTASAVGLKLQGACTEANGGTINTGDTGNSSGWSTGLCVRHTVSSTNSELPFRVSGYANFSKFAGLKATPANLLRCANSVVILNFYTYTAAAGTWQKVQTVKAKASPKFKIGGTITSCKADAGTKYAVGAWMYRTIVMAIDGDGKNNGNPIASLIRSAYGYY